MGLGIQAAHQFQRLAAVDQIIDDQDAGAIAHQLGLRRFDDLRFGALIGGATAQMIGFHRDRIDHADVQLAADDHGGHQPAAGDADHSLPRPAFARTLAIQPPGQRARVAVDLVP